MLEAEHVASDVADVASGLEKIQKRNLYIWILTKVLIQ